MPITNEVIQRVNQLGPDNNQRSLGGNFKYARSQEVLSDTESDSDMSDDNSSKSNNLEVDTTWSDQSVNDSIRNVKEDEYQHDNNEDVENQLEDFENKKDLNDDPEYSREVIKKNNSVETSDRVLRPRTRRIDYSMYHRYEDTQLL